MLDKLRAMGRAGAFVANVLQVLLGFPGVTVPVVIAAIVGIWASAVAWIERPAVYIPALLFLFLLWTSIGILTLKDRKSPRQVKVIHDHAHSLICDGGWDVFFARFGKDHAWKPEGDCISLAIKLRNTSPVPVRAVAEEFRVQLNGMASDDGVPPPMVFSRFAPKALRSNGVYWDKQNDTRLVGTASLVIMYGQHDRELDRRYVIKAKIEIVVNPANDGRVNYQVFDIIVEESDTRIKS